MINQRINGLPEFVKTCRSDKAEEAFRIRNPDDFALDAVLGDITSTFGTAFRGVYFRPLNADEAQQAMLIVNGKAREIRIQKKRRKKVKCIPNQLLHHRILVPL